MSSTTTNTGQAIETSFLGLQSYTEAQSNSFFGRDAETDTLTSLINLNTLTIVFGRSGTGKTSLLNAGVFPKLRKSFCLPFRIRLEFNENSPPLVTQIKKILKEEIDKYGFKVESYPQQETLWEYFHKEHLWKTVTPILVFDQFEEIFTLAKANPGFASTELPAFWEELSDLIENNIPEKLKDRFLNQKEKVGYNYKKQKAKIVFSFREEYLPEFESIAAKIPSLKYSRFRLLPMNGNQAYEVITKTWKENITPKEAKHIVSYFTNEPGVEDHALVTVEPSLLSQVCAYIDKGRIESGGGKVSAELLNKYRKETILRSIYEEATEAANKKLSADDERKKSIQYNPVKVFLEDKLITSEGYRIKYNLGGNDESLRPAINELNRRYFIREDDNALELTHDVVAPVIKTDREARRKETAQAAFRKKAKRLVIAALLLGLGLVGYALYEREKVISDLSDLKKEISDSTASLKRLNEAINDARSQNPNDPKPIKPKPGPNDPDYPGIEPGDKTIEELRAENEKLMLINKGLSDSVGLLGKNITDLNLKIGNISRIQTQNAADLQTAKDQLVILRRQAKADADTIIALKNRIDGLNNDLMKANERARILQDSTKFLWGMIRNLKERLNAPSGPSTNPGNLRIQVYDQSGESKIPITKDTFFVYIIPYKGANKKILDDNKNILFANDCDGINKLLPELGRWQKAYFKDGYYYFHNVLPNGKYKIKICNILNGYFNLSLPSQSGNVFWRQTEKQKIAIKLGTF